jgi:hypothetical protein
MPGVNKNEISTMPNEIYNRVKPMVISKKEGKMKGVQDMPAIAIKNSRRLYFIKKSLRF